MDADVGVCPESRISDKVLRLSNERLSDEAEAGRVDNTAGIKGESINMGFSLLERVFISDIAMNGMMDMAILRSAIQKSKSIWPEYNEDSFQFKNIVIKYYFEMYTFPLLFEHTFSESKPDVSISNTNTNTNTNQDDEPSATVVTFPDDDEFIKSISFK